METPIITEKEDSIGDLRDYIRHKRSIPSHLINDRCRPPHEEANVILVTPTQAFKYNRQRLARRCPTFADIYLTDLGDDSVDIIDDCPVVNLPDSYDHNAGYVYCFLKALANDDPSPYPLQSLKDYRYLSSILCLASTYRLYEMRIKALMVLERLYPSTFDAWNAARKIIRQANWRIDHAEVINLARWVEAWNILPVAMATLVNDMSAHEVFNLPLDYEQHIPQPVTINSTDAPAFAIMKEHSFISTRKMLLWMRSLGEGCNDAPEWLPSMVGKAPVGALKPKPAQCAAAFKAMVAQLLDQVYLVEPVGYADFYDQLKALNLDRSRVCKKCRIQFEKGHVEMREIWWNKLPVIMRFKGWTDPRMRPASSMLVPVPEKVEDPLTKGLHDPEGPRLF